MKFWVATISEIEDILYKRIAELDTQIADQQRKLESAKIEAMIAWAIINGSQPQAQPDTSSLLENVHSIAAGLGTLLNQKQALAEVMKRLRDPQFALEWSAFVLQLEQAGRPQV